MALRAAMVASESAKLAGSPAAAWALARWFAQQQADVADVASRIFGVAVQPGHVITETLVRATTAHGADASTLAVAVRARGYAESDDPALHVSIDTLRADPVASWIEDNFGVVAEPHSGRLVRCPLRP